MVQEDFLVKFPGLSPPAGIQTGHLYSKVHATQKILEQTLWCAEWVPKEIQVLIPRACECVTLQSKRNFVAVIKDFEMGQFSWVTWVGQSNNKTP